MKNEFKFRTSIYIVITIAFLVEITAACYFFELENRISVLASINYFDLLLGQIANTLIVLSLTSVLSTNFGQAYWIDIKEAKLVEPFWGCFIGITVYLLTGTVFSIISFALGINVGIVVSALLATILLIILTFKMISIYFGKEGLKKRLFVEYKQLLILTNYSYVTDYLVEMEKYAKEVEKLDFPGKGQYVRRIKKHIGSIKEKWNSGNKEAADKALKLQTDIHMAGIAHLQEIDQKIVEYTKNAISANDSEVVRENIELLVDCENCATFFNLLEALFDWDEEYACNKLVELKKKRNDFVVENRMSIFMQYALRKLITQSGNLNSVQKLLSIYDLSNLGMSKLKPELKAIKSRSLAIKEKENELHREMINSEDFISARKKYKELKKGIDEELAALEKSLEEIWKGTTTKDLRYFYFPIREACTAYEEGEYETVNRYIMIMIADYQLDLQFIKLELPEVGGPMDYSFSYVTEDENTLLSLLLEKDKDRHIITDANKDILTGMQNVKICDI